MSKQCPEGKILNPATGRCVLKSGKIGKALLGKRPSSGAASRPVVSSGGSSSCPHGTVRNPRTKKCVSVTSAAGMQLIAPEGARVPAGFKPLTKAAADKLMRSQTAVPVAMGQLLERETVYVMGFDMGELHLMSTDGFSDYYATLEPRWGVYALSRNGEAIYYKEPSKKTKTASLRLSNVRTPVNSRGRPLGGLTHVGLNKATPEQIKKYALFAKHYMA